MNVIFNKFVLMENKLTEAVRSVGGSDLVVWHEDDLDEYRLYRRDSISRTFIASLGAHADGEKRLMQAAIDKAKAATT